MAKEMEKPGVRVFEEATHPALVQSTAMEISKKPEPKYKQIFKASKRNSRIEELAKPSKASVKFVYDTYQNILPDRNKRVMYNLIKDEAAKAAEKTEEKFKKNLRKLTGTKYKK